MNKNGNLCWGKNKKQENTRTLNREAYAHPNDPNLMIYPERRDREPWTEQLIFNWLDPKPQTKAQHRKEQLSLLELGHTDID